MDELDVDVSDDPELDELDPFPSELDDEDESELLDDELEELVEPPEELLASLR
ncbi:MAG: hypothetical protein AAGA93_04760 [Actinomycetota bacterium]